jgi:hypothetical protein
MKWWRWLSLPWFLIKLGCCFAWTLVSLSVTVGNWWPSTPLLFLAAWYLATLLFRGDVPVPAEPAKISPPPLKLDQVENVILSPPQLLEQEKMWQASQSQQPLHRDLLINLGLAAWYQNQPEKAQELWNIARKLDPNNPVWVWE